MQMVTVVFTLDGKITVVPDEQGAKSRSLVIWDITNYNPAVERVKIEFKSPHAYFGADNPNGGKFEIFKKISDALMIWGQAPPVGGGKVEAQKYTVYGQDSLGHDVVNPLDPRIVVTEP